MQTRTSLMLATLTALLFATGCSRAPAGEAPSPSDAPQAARSSEGPGGPGRRGGGPGGSDGEVKPYDEVITDEAETKDGLFRTHRVGDDLYFEIPDSILNREMLLLDRTVHSTEQSQDGFFRGGGQRIVRWERQGDRVVLREMEYDLVADSSAAIHRQVAGMRMGPVIGAFRVEAYGADSAAVVKVTDLYTTPNTDMGSIEGLQRDRSWIEDVWAFPRNVEVEATQTGQARNGGGGPPSPFGGGRQGPRTETKRVHWSMVLLPEKPMMPRLHDRRVGYRSTSWVDYSRPVHKAERRRVINRFRLEKANPSAEISDPVEPIVWWIDPATPEWLRPWVKTGVEAWQPAFEEAGFSNAIVARLAPTPEEDPDFSLFDARHSVIYWRPSTVSNATGGRTADPRTGEILKGEVTMYHDIQSLLQSWYFIQVSPLDERARSLPLPDSLMGKLVEYVVAHEIGHSIGFPHNMKASAMYPVDSIRSESFLRRMGGHVATLMDYSRMNYVAQPEDSIPPELLIPGVGPYDRFAVKWGYAPIPGADTPEEEREVLDEWARQQDTMPWLRYTTDDAPNDPYSLTEAVGDADAVRATTLALRNLDRVMESLLPVAERPGEDYELLDDLYGAAVSQWGRYMGHVAAVIGGAETQEKYGTGPRFDPVSRDRQEEAMEFLAGEAFRTPERFIDREILRRIEAEGVVPRIRSAQSRVLRTLLNEQRLNRLVEYEALAPEGERPYTVAEMTEDLREAVWTELGQGSVSVDVYRRNLQRAHLEVVDATLNPEEDEDDGPRSPFAPPRPPRWNSDVRPVLRGELRALDRAAERALQRAADPMTRLHLEDVRMEIERILEGEGR